MIADGRSQPPSVPNEVYWLGLARRINHSLGTNYRPEELPLLPGDDLDRLLVWIQYVK